MRNLLCIFILFALSVNSLGDQRENTSNVKTEVVSTLDAENTTKLTEQEKNLAKQWMLSESDWVKYKNIMKGPRGIWSPGLDPITALGVSTTEIKERKRYAEIWMKMEIQRTEMELAFEVERQRAASRIVGNQLAVNNTPWIKEWEKKKTETRKKVFLFTDVLCLEKCKPVVEEIRASVGDNAKLDIFFKNGATSDGIGKWASYMKIPREVVKTRKITLNYDDGKSSEYKVDVTKLPQVRVLDLKTGEITATYK